MLAINLSAALLLLILVFWASSSSWATHPYSLPTVIAGGRRRRDLFREWGGGLRLCLDYCLSLDPSILRNYRREPRVRARVCFPSRPLRRSPERGRAQRNNSRMGHIERRPKKTQSKINHGLTEAEEGSKAATNGDGGWRDRGEDIKRLKLHRPSVDEHK